MTQEELKQSTVYKDRLTGNRIFCSRNYGEIKLFPLSGKQNIGAGAGAPVSVTEWDADVFAQHFDLEEEIKETNEANQ